jgi:hypothetical protein
MLLRMHLNKLAENIDKLIHATHEISRFKLLVFADRIYLIFFIL